MRLKSFVWNSLTFTFPTAQANVNQRARFTRDGVAMGDAIGEWPALGESNLLQSLEVAATIHFGVGQTINGSTRATPSALATAIDEMFKVIGGGQGQLYATREDGSDLWAWAKLQTYTRPSDPTARRLISIPLTFAIQDTWYDDDGGCWEFDDGYDFDTAGLHFDMSGSHYSLGMSSNDTLVVSNGGNLAARVMDIVISHASGSVVNPKLENTTNDYWFSWTGSVTGDLVVRPGTQSIQHAGTDEYDDLDYGTNQREWMKFDAGSNTIKLTFSGGGTVDLNISFYPPYYQA